MSKNKQPKTVTATLVLKVVYEDSSETGSMTYQEMIKEAKAFLEQIPQRAAGNGQLSGDSDMTVKNWNAEVVLEY